MGAGPSLLRHSSGTAQAPFASAVGIPNPLPVFGDAVGPVLPTLLGLTSPPAPQRVLKPSRDVRSAAAGCGEDCRQKMLLPSRRAFGQVCVLASRSGPS